MAKLKCAICQRERRLRRGPEPLYTMPQTLENLAVRRRGSRAHVSCIRALERSLKRKAQKQGRSLQELLA